MSTARRYLAPVAVILVLLGAWELAARWDWISNALNIEDFLVPAPSDIAKSLWEDRSLLGSNAWVTLKEVLFGFAIAAVAGIGFALLIHLSETARRAVYPLLIASQTIPIVIARADPGRLVRLRPRPRSSLIVALICFFPITVNMLDGLRSVDPDLTKMLRSLGAGRLQRLWRARFRPPFPTLQRSEDGDHGLRDRRRLRRVTSAERGARPPDPNQAQAQLLTARLFAAVVVLSAMAILLFALVSLIERKVVTWDSRGVTRS